MQYRVFVFGIKFHTGVLSAIRSRYQLGNDMADSQGDGLVTALSTS